MYLYCCNTEWSLVAVVSLSIHSDCVSRVCCTVYVAVCGQTVPYTLYIFKQSLNGKLAVLSMDTEYSGLTNFSSGADYVSFRSFLAFCISAATVFSVSIIPLLKPP